MDVTKLYGVRLDDAGRSPRGIYKPIYIAERITDESVYYFALFVRAYDAHRYAKWITEEAAIGKF